jgi:hypothetical protein
MLEILPFILMALCLNTVSGLTFLSASPSPAPPPPSSSSSSSSYSSSSSSSSSSSNADLRVLNGILPVSCLFLPLFQFVISNLLVSISTQSHHLFFGRPLSLIS